ncbi:hypothetical protein K2Z83_18535 [Oscillochloris sp. ZM17-4]|uniref:hypothetical protein n=1 Tax=Oscillochloris sp. ZM17-4 TaxID=2866714 RepID=UPI001C73489A|nr:hypothetical protein [Oscillochloris sp. ZM17-4]MBX0329671.1 hypothetical protein [Oscillochloris sp. ZM17-4]
MGLHHDDHAQEVAEIIVSTQKRWGWFSRQGVTLSSGQKSVSNRLSGRSAALLGGADGPVQVQCSAARPNAWPRRAGTSPVFEILDSPSKHLVILDHAGHRALFDQPAAFAALMREVREAS